VTREARVHPRRDDRCEQLADANSSQRRRRARMHTSLVVGDDPVLMLGGPVPATRKLFSRIGESTLDDIGVFEVDEAFASIPLAWAR
jgi:acetyl-CoA acetyltransferase